jgi:hypothetical protein
VAAPGGWFRDVVGTPAHQDGTPVDDFSGAVLRPGGDHACPAGGTEIYTDEGRTPDFNATCAGTSAVNGLYGEGFLDAARAVARR